MTQFRLLVLREWLLPRHIRVGQAVYDVVQTFSFEQIVKTTSYTSRPYMTWFRYHSLKTKSLQIWELSQSRHIQSRPHMTWQHVIYGYDVKYDVTVFLSSSPLWSYFYNVPVTMLPFTINEVPVYDVILLPLNISIPNYGPTENCLGLISFHCP